MEVLIIINLQGVMIGEVGAVLARAADDAPALRRAVATSGGRSAERDRAKGEVIWSQYAMEHPARTNGTWTCILSGNQRSPLPIARNSRSTRESLIGGQLVARAWNGAGFINPWEDARLDPARHPTPFSFWLEVDGHLLHSHWEWGSLQQEERDGKLHVTIELRHGLRPVTVRVHMLLDGTPIFTRWLEDYQHQRRARPTSLPPTPGAAYCNTAPGPTSFEAARAGSLYSVGYMNRHPLGRRGRFPVARPADRHLRHSRQATPWSAPPSHVRAAQPTER